MSDFDGQIFTSDDGSSITLFHPTDLVGCEQEALRIAAVGEYRILPVPFRGGGGYAVPGKEHCADGWKVDLVRIAKGVKREAVYQASSEADAKLSREQVKAECARLYSSNRNPNPPPDGPAPKVQTRPEKLSESTLKAFERQSADFLWIMRCLKRSMHHDRAAQRWVIDDQAAALCDRSPPPENQTFSQVLGNITK